MLFYHDDRDPDSGVHAPPLCVSAAFTRATGPRRAPHQQQDHGAQSPALRGCGSGGGVWSSGLVAGPEVGFGASVSRALPCAGRFLWNPCLTSVQDQHVPSLTRVQKQVAGRSAWPGTEFPRSGTFGLQTSQVRDKLRQPGRPNSEPRETLRIRADRRWAWSHRSLRTRQPPPAEVSPCFRKRPPGPWPSRRPR